MTLEQEYDQLYDLYKLESSSWDFSHMTMDWYYFNNNKKRVISEYLAWEDFVERAQKNKTAYFYAIDIFLKEYKEAVYSCLKI